MTSPIDLTIRPIRAEDEAAWRPMWRAYLDFYETSVPDSTYDHAFAQLLSDDPASFNGLIAQQGDTPLGLVHFVFHPHLWRPEGTCYLLDLFTNVQARGQGVGRRLIEAVYDAADTRGVPSVYWMTQEFNYSGRMLYDRVGAKTPFIRYNRPA